MSVQVKCEACNGTGRRIKKSGDKPWWDYRYSCSRCSGTGLVIWIENIIETKKEEKGGTDDCGPH